MCPISCAMVKAVARPMSSLMLQLLSGSHIPPTGANPDTDTCARAQWHGHTHTHICYNTIHLIFNVRVGRVFLTRLTVSATFSNFICTKGVHVMLIKIANLYLLSYYHIFNPITNTFYCTNSFTIYCTVYSYSCSPVAANRLEVPHIHRK